ncbi:MAG TPA: type II toxin-antitoxin system VapC family toxin [Thermoanaerobaculia bacterium]|jgi:ribonuclease VapC
MIVDSSAVAAIFFRRPGYERLIDTLAGAGSAGIGAPTLAEAALEIGAAAGRDAQGLVARFVQEFHLAVIPFGDAHSRAAADAHRRFGSGRAALDLGECLAYATARLAKQPLLADDPRFAATDLELA